MLLNRLKSMVSSFIEENRMYDATFVYRGEDILETIRDDLKKISHMNTVGWLPPFMDTSKFAVKSAQQKQ